MEVPLTPNCNSVTLPSNDLENLAVDILKGFKKGARPEDFTKLKKFMESAEDFRDLYS